MPILALGLNHHTAPIAIRERAAIAEGQLGEALTTLRQVGPVNEAAIVSTCNRTEIYCGMDQQDTRSVIEWMHRYFELRDKGFEPYLFHHADREAVRHLMRVCSGLDSMILGEPQILGQIKRAYRDAYELGAMGSELSTLFQTAFSVAKQVRSDTAIGNSPVSIAFAAVSLARQIFSNLGEQSALLIGAGETIQLAARHLKRAGIGTIRIANRTPERAALLAAEVGGLAIELKDIPDALPQADIIISSTGSALPILGKGTVQRALKQRKFRPQLIVDIAVPRDVEAEVNDIDGAFLYTVDDLQAVIEGNRLTRQEAAFEAEQIVTAQVDLFMRKLQTLGATDLIRSYRGQVGGIRDAAIEKSLRQLRAGQDPEMVLKHLAHSLSNKVMHKPTARMRQAAEEGNHSLLDAARSLLDLPSKTP
ncbi:MAG: glutamyl-tRNA reductase [Granulosicoccus sp.]|nr:glutamyl-tRNA reductase [Granulosicoccus sp.]